MVKLGSVAFFHAFPWPGSPELRKTAIVATPPLSICLGEVTIARAMLYVKKFSHLNNPPLQPPFDVPIPLCALSELAVLLLGLPFVEHESSLLQPLRSSAALSPITETRRMILVGRCQASRFGATAIGLYVTLPVTGK